MAGECRNIQILPEKDCCGCGACDNSCPVNAITMKENKDGFLYPQVEETTCINCGKCVKACPELTPDYSNTKEPVCFAAYGPDEIRMQSSSGGIFTLLAEEVLAEEGAVCGAAMEKDFVVAHRLIEKKEDLSALRGSKYVQSQIGNTYREIKKELEKGRKILFSGVPCQVAGLKGYLGKEYKNLLTIDVVCHGVPSPGMFRKYITEKYGKGKLSGFQFRTKEFGHNCNNCIAHLKNGKRVVGNPANDPYERAFHRSLMLRTSCGDCKFAPVPRQGDLTLGDFWHIEKYNPDFADQKGVSLVLVNSEKGEEAWNKLASRLAFCESVPLEFTLKHNRFRSKIRIPEGRESFFEEVQNQSFKKSVEIGLGEKFSRKMAMRQWLKLHLPEVILRKLRNRG